MKDEIIREEIRKHGSVPEIAAKLGCTRASIYNKLGGTCPWKITELLALSRIFGWTVEEFLNIIEFKEEQ